MNLLVSDYDNTFHIKDCDMKKNTEMSEEYRKNNLFVIATGRSYESYKGEEEKFNIKTDYLVINHGATILKDDKIIYNKPIADEIKEQLIKDLEIDTAEYIHCYKEKDEVDITESNITKVLIDYKDHETAVRMRDMVKNKFAGKLKNFHFTTYNSVEVVSADVDKSIAVDIISKLENPNEIYVIGDNHNDYDMIKKYNGNCTKVAVEEVKQISKKQYENVSDYIEEIIEKR